MGESETATENIVTIEEFLVFKQHPLIKDSIENLMSDPRDQISCANHALFRNYIMLRLVIRNGCRSCVLANLTFNEFKNVESTEDDLGQYFVFRIAKHKTVLEHGCAMLVADQELYEKMKIYESVFRNQMTL